MPTSQKPAFVPSVAPRPVVPNVSTHIAPSISTSATSSTMTNAPEAFAAPEALPAPEAPPADLTPSHRETWLELQNLRQLLRDMNDDHLELLQESVRLAERNELLTKENDRLKAQLKQSAAKTSPQEKSRRSMKLKQALRNDSQFS